MAEQNILHLQQGKKAEKTFDISPWSREAMRRVQAWHATFPDYQFTPLHRLPGLAGCLGLGEVLLKDESKRFGLNAFKAVGGSYAMGRYIAGLLGRPVESLSYAALTSPEVKKRLGEITFVTATDGNHGRGVAWTAARLRQKAVVLMPKGSSPERLANIRAEGAEAHITELNYDDTARQARALAEENGWVMIQDTTLENYEEIPGWIMQGYGSIAWEIGEQIAAAGLKPPTHVILQAGAGSFAGAMVACLTSLYPEATPRFIIVEPAAADCIFRTAKAADGRLHFVTGQWSTIMAGLSVGEPCSIGWKIFKEYADDYVSCPDYVAAKGMRVLGNPLADDPRIISGESGAVPLGFLAEAMLKPDQAGLRRALGLDEKARVLCISTEGDTDREQYRRIVWDGEYPSF